MHGGEVNRLPRRVRLSTLGRVIDAALARRLVDEQFPEWSDRPIDPVPVGGVDNRTFRLGDDLSLRLPSGDWYALQVAKEQRWLPRLAPDLPLPIPVPVAQGRPGAGYPYDWSVYRWLEGEPTQLDAIRDLTEFAVDLAAFLVDLRQVDSTGGPGPGRHNFFRGGPLTTYDEETRTAVATLGTDGPGAAALAVWDDALAAPFAGPPVWFHGDVATGNLLLRDGRLAAVIDFGCSAVGDPACDVVIAWTLFSGPSRLAYRSTLGIDAGTWARGRGWALWKALITVAGDPEGPYAEASRRVIAEVIADRD